MGRLLVLIALVALSVYLLKKIYLSAPEQMKNKGSEDKDIGLMKKCAQCELHIPSEHAHYDDQGHAFCSEEHKQAYKG